MLEVPGRVTMLSITYVAHRTVHKFRSIWVIWNYSCWTLPTVPWKKYAFIICFFPFINKCAFEGLYTLVGCSKILEVLCFIQSMEIYTVECALQSSETNVLYLLRQGALLQVKVNKITPTKTQLPKYTAVNRFLWRLGIGQCLSAVCVPLHWGEWRFSRLSGVLGGKCNGWMPERWRNIAWFTCCRTGCFVQVFGCGKEGSWPHLAGRGN